MSAWQSIGLVISVLWALGLPIYLMADTNRKANDFYMWCLTLSYQKIQPGTSTQDLELAQTNCRYAHQQSVMPPAKLLQLLTTDKAAGIVWLIILVPIAIFWVVSATVLSTVRWIQRGFAAEQHLQK